MIDPPFGTTPGSRCSTVSSSASLRSATRRRTSVATNVFVMLPTRKRSLAFVAVCRFDVAEAAGERDRAAAVAGEDDGAGHAGRDHPVERVPQLRLGRLRPMPEPARRHRQCQADERKQRGAPRRVAAFGLRTI